MTFDDQLKQAVDTLGDHLRDLLSHELRLVADNLLASAQADREAAAVEAAERVAADLAASARTASDRLVEAVRAIDRARSLTEVLDALAGSAGREASRAAVLLVSGDRVRGWRFVGFPAVLDASQIECPLGESGIIADAVEQKLTTSTSASGKSGPSFALLENQVSAEAIAIPVALSGEVVAVLYADQVDAELGTLNPESSPLNSGPLELLALHAARSLEALTAFKAVRSITGADTGSPAGTPAGSTPGPTPDDEDEAARRYARLLISEIKLYHGDAVAEGQRDRDLATRLGGEIARARALYEQRVSPHVRGAAEHFHAELVRTLAGGDASLFAKAGVS